MKAATLRAEIADWINGARGPDCQFVAECAFVVLMVGAATGLIVTLFWLNIL